MSKIDILLDAFETEVYIQSDNPIIESRKSQSSISDILSLSYRSIDGENGKEEGNSEILTSFLLLNSMIGSGILNQPQVFQKSGIIAAIIMFVVSSYLIWLGLNVLIIVGVQRGKFDYSDLAKSVLGNAGERSVNYAIVIGNFTAILSYITVIGGTASDLLIGWGCNSPGCSVYIATVIFILFFVLPICLFRIFGHLAWYSVVSMLSIGSVLLLVIIVGPIVGNSNGSSTLFSRGCGSQLGSIIFSLSCAFATFHIYMSMKDPSLEKWTRVSRNTVIIGFFMLLSMGLAGYLSFGSETDGLIVNNFEGGYSDFFKVLLILHLVL